MLFCGDLLWIFIRVTRIKRLISRFSFGWFLIVTLKWFSFYVRRAKKIQSFKVSCEYICSVLDLEVCGSKYFS